MFQIEQHLSLAKAAKLLGTSTDSMRRWVAEEGYAFNRSAVGRGRSAILPVSLIRRIAERHGVRVVAAQ